MYIYRPNSGYHGNRQRPTRMQRRAEDERITALLIAADDHTTDNDAAHDLFVGTVDADFELMDQREVRIGGSVITFGCGPEPVVERREAA